MSVDWAKDIAKMHTKFKAREGLVFNSTFLRFRQRFLEEEFREMDEAILENNPEAVVDALIDICVVAIGTLDLGGVNAYVAWDAVLEANMKKEAGNNPTRQGSGGYDLIKPDGWNPPNHFENTGFFANAISQICEEHEDFLERKKRQTPSHIRTLEAYRDHAMDKTHDYDDAEDPEFFHAEYYPSGINDIMYEISKKVKRIKHGLKRFFETGKPPKTDSLHDSFRDISIYSAIGDTYLHGNLEGQTPDRDIFNREKK